MSSKTIAEKLQVKANRKVLILNEPKDYKLDLGKLPSSVVVTDEISAEPFDIVIVFVSTKKELEKELPQTKTLLSKNGFVWVGYPKGNKVDVNRDSIRKYADTIGLQAVGLVSVDSKWSALRLKISQLDFIYCFRNWKSRASRKESETQSYYNAVMVVSLALGLMDVFVY